MQFGLCKNERSHLFPGLYFPYKLDQKSVLDPGKNWPDLKHLHNDDIGLNVYVL